MPEIDPVREQHAVLAAMSHGELDVVVAGVAERDERVVGAVLAGLHRVSEVGPAVVDGLAQQVEMVVEVAVDGGGRDPSRSGDGTQRDALDRVVGRHQVGRGLEQVLTRSRSPSPRAFR